MITGSFGKDQRSFQYEGSFASYFGEIDDELRDILDDILNNRTEYIEDRPSIELELPYDDTLDVEIEDDTPRVIIIEDEDTQCSRVVIIDLC